MVKPVKRSVTDVGLLSSNIAWVTEWFKAPATVGGLYHMDRRVNPGCLLRSGFQSPGRRHALNLFMDPIGYGSSTWASWYELRLDLGLGYNHIDQVIPPSTYSSINPSIYSSINPSSHSSINPFIHQSINSSIYSSIQSVAFGILLLSTILCSGVKQHRPWSVLGWVTVSVCQFLLIVLRMRL